MMEAGGGVRRGEREVVEEERLTSRREGEVWIRAMAESEAPTSWPSMRAGKVDTLALNGILSKQNDN